MCYCSERTTTFKIRLCIYVFVCFSCWLKSARHFAHSQPALIQYNVGSVIQRKQFFFPRSWSFLGFFTVKKISNDGKFVIFTVKKPSVFLGARFFTLHVMKISSVDVKLGILCQQRRFSQKGTRKAPTREEEKNNPPPPQRKPTP